MLAALRSIADNYLSSGHSAVHWPSDVTMLVTGQRWRVCAMTGERWRWWSASRDMSNAREGLSEIQRHCTHGYILWCLCVCVCVCVCHSVCVSILVYNSWRKSRAKRRVYKCYRRPTGFPVFPMCFPCAPTAFFNYCLTDKSHLTSGRNNTKINTPCMLLQNINVFIHSLALWLSTIESILQWHHSEVPALSPPRFDSFSSIICMTLRRHCAVRTSHWLFGQCVIITSTNVSGVPRVSQLYNYNDTWLRTRRLILRPFIALLFVVSQLTRVSFAQYNMQIILHIIHVSLISILLTESIY